MRLTTFRLHESIAPWALDEHPAMSASFDAFQDRARPRDPAEQLAIVHLEEIDNVDVAVEHRPLFQYVRHQRRMRIQRTLQVGEPSLDRRLWAEAMTARAAPKPIRCSLLLWDGNSILVLQNPEAQLWLLPSGRFEEGDSLIECALAGLDTQLGPLLRQSARMHALVHDAAQHGRPLGQFGNSLYFEIRLPPLALHDNRIHLVAAFAKRRATPTLAKAAPEFSVVAVADADANLRSEDQAAVREMRFPTVMRAPDEVMHTEGGGACHTEETSDGPTRTLPEQRPTPEMTSGLSKLSDFDKAVLQQLLESRPQLRKDLAPLGAPRADAATEVAALFDEGKQPRTRLGEAGVNASQGAAAGRTPPYILPTLQDIQAEQRIDQEVAILLDFTLGGESALETPVPAKQLRWLRQVAHNLLVLEGTLCLKRNGGALGEAKRPRIVIPKKFRLHLLASFHDRLGHPGTTRTTRAVDERFWWPGMRAEIRDYVRRCRPCRFAKVPRKRAGERQLVANGQHPWDIVSIDVYTVGMDSYRESSPYPGLPFTKVVVCCDQFSRSVLAIACKGEPCSEDYVQMLHDYLFRFKSVPRAIRTDSASVLISQIVKLYFKKFGIRMEHSTAGHHDTVGVPERFNSTLGALIKTQRLSLEESCMKEFQWELYLTDLEVAYNALVHSVTGYSPFFLEHGRDPNLPMDICTHGRDERDGDIDDFVASHMDRLHAAWQEACKRLRRFNVSAKLRQDRHRDTELCFHKGQRVLLLKLNARQVDGGLPKAEEPFDGPFRIAEVLPRDTYRLQDLHTRRTRDVVHVSRLEPYPDRTNDGDKNLDDDEFFVDRIVDRRVVNQGNDDEGDEFQYKIRWRGYLPEEDSWKTIEDLRGCLDLVVHFNQSHPLKSVRERQLVAARKELLPGFDDEPLPLVVNSGAPAFRYHPASHPRHQGIEDEFDDSYEPYVIEEGSPGTPLETTIGDDETQLPEAEKELSEEELLQRRLLRDDRGNLFFDGHCENSQCTFPQGHGGGHSFEVDIDVAPPEGARGPTEHRWEHNLSTGQSELKVKLWRASNNSRQSGSFRFYVYSKSLSDVELQRCEDYARNNHLSLPEL